MGFGQILLECNPVDVGVSVLEFPHQPLPRLKNMHFLSGEILARYSNSPVLIFGPMSRGFDQVPPGCRRVRYRFVSVPPGAPG
jgi:hypothetical protein